ncbi:MAG: hypothetical protein R2697_04985 [Ilumatobacteraceae bacterium]
MISIIESSMCPWTAIGCRSTRTEMPPRTALATTPITSHTDSHVRSRRRGTRQIEPRTAAMTATPTMPVNRRFTCSIAACFDDTSMSDWELQFGQSSHPSPLFVRRTAAPVTMIADNATSAPIAIVR